MYDRKKSKLLFQGILNILTTTWVSSDFCSDSKSSPKCATFHLRNLHVENRKLYTYMYVLDLLDELVNLPSNMKQPQNCTNKNDQWTSNIIRPMDGLTVF